MRSKSLAVLAALLSGCVSGYNVLPPETTKTLVGLSKTQLFDCMGIPGKSARAEQVEYLSYRFEDADRNAVWNCEARFKVENDKVTKVDIHTTVENVFGRSKSLCLDAMRTCGKPN